MYFKKTPYHLSIICATMASLGTSAAAQPAARAAAPLFLTATNGATNYLVVVNANTRETDFLPTGGAGGVPAGSNEGAVAVSGKLAAVINFGSSNVSIFERRGNTLQAIAMIPTVAPPVSVDFGHGHLVVLETTTAESFPVFGNSVSTTADGAVTLAKADGSAGEIKTYAGGAVYIEKSGAVSLLNLSTNGAPGLSGPNVPVALPAAPNNDTPLGMVTRGANIYLSIAHSNLEVMVTNGKIVSMAPAPVTLKDAAGNLLHAACWNALYEHFLFTSDTAAFQIVRYMVSDTNIFYDKGTAAKLTGKPNDLAISQELLGVIDSGDGATSNVSLFEIDSEGELTSRLVVKVVGPLNGAAFIR